MRIVYLAPLDPSLHLGNSAHVRRLVEALEGRGHTVRLVCLTPSGRFQAPRGGMDTLSLSGPPRWRHLTAEWRAAGLVRRELQERLPDLLLARLGWFSLAPLLLPRRTPLFVECNVSIPRLAKACGADPLRVRALSCFEGMALRRAAAVGVVSPRLRHIQVAAHRLDPARVEVIPNGTWLPPLLAPTEILRLREECGAAKNHFVLAFVGNLNRVQGLDTLLRALARCKSEEVVLWVIGAGVAGADLLRLAADLGILGRIRFLGARPEEEAAALAQAAQVMVAPYVPSVFREAGPDSLKVLQAMACDRPVLTASCPDLAYIEELGAGVCVPSPEPEAWASTLAGWLVRWRDAGRPLTGWPWAPGKGPGRAYVAAERAWGQTAAAWERLHARTVGGG